MTPTRERQLVDEATAQARRDYPDASELAIASQAVLILSRRWDEYEHGLGGTKRDGDMAALYFRAAMQARHRFAHLSSDEDAA